MTDIRLGQIYAIFAFLIWGGLSPLYFGELLFLSSFQFLLYSVIFSFCILLFLILLKNESSALLSILKDMKKLKYLFISSCLILVNWLIFIWGLSNNNILEISLGCYLNPFVNVLLGYFFLNEKMTKKQYIAIFITANAVLLQFIALGGISLLTISLALTFGFYGFIRKKADVPSLVGLFVEVLLILPFSIGCLIYLISKDNSVFHQVLSFYNIFLLIIGGLITVIPLLLFNGAARRMKLTTLGFFQFIGPSSAFLIAVFVYNEDLTFEKIIIFSLIWISLIIFSSDTLFKLISKRIRR